MNSIQLERIDLIIIFTILIVIIGVGIWVGQTSKRSLEGFFLGGRNIPWALAGLSMVATTFAADTPLAVTEIIGMNGVSGNWIWWNLLAGGMLTSIVFAPLWRRAGVVTEAELIELRYHGKPAFILRVFRAIYLGFFINLLILGWVHVAMISVLEGLFGITYDYAFGLTAIITLLVAVYAALSGLLGVVVTDAMQFIIAMTGSIALAVFVIQSEEVGGLSGLKSSLSSEQLNFFPDFSKDNTDGFFLNYKSLSSKVAKVISEVNSGFQYPNALASNLFEMANNHIYFAKHLPRLTDISIKEDNFEEVENMLYYFTKKLLA